MITALRNLAEQIDTEWKATGYKPADLSGIAARLLSDIRPDRTFDLSALADWTLSQPTFPSACNPFGPLGPPAFTVWSNQHFFVNVYAYTTPEVVIHDHDFTGAFMNLSGITIHCTYEFPDADLIDDSVHIGGLRLRGIEAISDGAIRQIEAGRGFIHQVWHISQPTVVLVVRTPPLDSGTRQFQYIRPSIATEVFRSDSMSVESPERFAITRKMAECLRTSRGAGVDYVKQLVKSERPWDAVWHLIENWRYLQSEGALDDVIAAGAKYQGEWFARVENAGQEVELFYSINWPRVVAARDRIVLALLMSFRSWRSIRKTLEGLLPGVDAREQIVESLGRLADDRTIALDFKPSAREALSSMLQNERIENDVAQTLRQQALLRPLLNFDT